MGSITVVVLIEATIEIEGEDLMYQGIEDHISDMSTDDLVRAGDMTITVE